VHHLASGDRHGGLEQIFGAVAVDAPECLPILGERHLGDVVMDHLDAIACTPNGVEVADVAPQELDLCRTIFDIDEIEHAHGRPAFEQSVA
jgi:hypothetical protein